jgi:two-component system sensor histidine kinase/response regulator
MKLLRWFDGYLSKPVKKGQLLSEIFRVFASDFEIELAELEAAEETVEEVEVQPAAAEAAAGSILVVEDHEVNQQLFKAILEKMGFQVLIAEDGLKALEAVREATFDLIFMDIQMPNLNGYDATRQLRKMGVRTPIVAVTASALKEEQKRALAAGMNGCLTKPFKKKDVLAVLARWLGPTSGFQSSGSENLAEAPAVGAFDFSKAVAAFMGREEVVRGVLGSFLEKLEDRLSAMIEAFDNGDMEWISREAHAIKGGAWNLEARSLGEAARSLEEAAGAGEAGRAGRALRRLQSESERFKKAVLPCLERGEGNAV